MPKRLRLRSVSRGRSLARARFGYGVASGVATASNLFRSRSRTNTSRKQAAPFPITGENDAQTVYRRKRMAFRRKRRWRGFVKKTRAVLDKTLGSHYYVITRTDTGTAASNKQGVTGIHAAMGLNGSSGTWGDVNQLVTLASTQTGGGALNDEMKIMITGWLCETQIVNASTVTVYIDMYYYRVKRRIVGSLGDPVTVFAEGLSDLAQQGTGTMESTDYGVTPFQSPEWAKNIRVWKKVRVKLAPGGVTQVETRSGRNYLRNFGVDEHYSADRCTEGILFVYYGAPSSNNESSSAILIAAPLRFSTNVNYSWRLLQDSRQWGGTNVP